MGRRPEPETIDVDPPREPIRPDEGYRVGARISAGDAGRTRLAGAVAIGIVLAGLAFAAIGPLLPSVPELPIAPVASRPPATPLPDVAVLRPPVSTRLLPVYAGGLRWLDPASGVMTGDPYTAARSGLFVDAEGRGLCVCLEIPWSQDRFVVRVTLRRYSATGVEVARATLSELASAEGVISGEPVQVDAAISPDGRELWIVRTVRAESSWQIGLDRVDLATLQVEASMELDPVLVPPLGDDGVLVTADGWVTHRRSIVRASPRISPDGERLAVLVVAFGRPGLDPQLPRYQTARIVVDASLAAGTVAEVAAPPRDASTDSCDIELSAWATNRHFITICSRPAGDGIQPFVRIETPGPHEVDVGPPVGTRDAEWLLDAGRRVLYRWSPRAHVFSRLHIPTETASTLAIDVAQTGLGAIDSWPGSVDVLTDWAPLTGPEQLYRPARMAGSADGTVIYALGFRSVADDIRDDRIASTGIWTFDAQRAELIAHWAPEALYDQIGFLPGREQLVTLGLPGSDAAGGPADWSTSLRFHDPSTGELLEVLGDVVEPSGYVPAIITPNAPRGIAGF